MSKIRGNVWIGCLSTLAVLSAGCGSGASSAVPGRTASPAAATAVPSAAATIRPSAQATSQPAAKSVALFAGEIPEYEGSGRTYMTGGSELKAEYSADLSLPLAVFLPENMIRFEQQKGGTAWGTGDKRNWIAFDPIGTEGSASGQTGEPAIDAGDTALLRYKEYLGAYPDGDGRIDMFELHARGEAYSAGIRTTAGERDELLPLFVDILREVQYMKKQSPLAAGVFVQEPDVGAGEESKQMLEEVMSCLEAIAGHDKEKFLTTMHSPEIGDYLMFFIENTTAYRFTELTYEGIPAEGTKRANFIAGYQSMTDEGYLAERNVTVSLLPNTQGEWKFANID